MGLWGTGRLHNSDEIENARDGEGKREEGAGGQGCLGVMGRLGGGGCGGK